MESRCYFLASSHRKLFNLRNKDPGSFRKKYPDILDLAICGDVLGTEGWNQENITVIRNCDLLVETLIMSAT